MLRPVSGTLRSSEWSVLTKWDVHLSLKLEVQPNGPSTLNEITMRSALFGDRMAFAALSDGQIEPSGALSYGELVTTACRMARGLREHGLAYGQRIGIVAMPRCEYPTTVLGALLAGASAAPINHLFKRRELVAYLNLLEPAAIVVDDDTIDGVREALPDLKRRRPLLIGVRDGLGADLHLTDLWRHHPAEPWPVTFDDPAIILHTSGTTGLPKAVVRSHGAYSAWANMWSRSYLLQTDRTLCFVPLYHQAALVVGWLASFAIGVPFFHMQRFHPEIFWDVVRRHDITWPTGLMAPSPARLLDQPPSHLDRDHSVRWVMGGSAPDMCREFERRFGCAIHTGYGSTETTMVTMPCSPGDVSQPFSAGKVNPRVHSSPCGWAIPGFSEFRVCRCDGSTTDTEEIGSLEVRGPAVFTQYFHDPTRTGQSFSSDGWFVPGDAAYVDAPGCLYVLGRTGEFIRRSGENIAPREVEAVIEEIPGIVEAAVVGVPDAARGAELLACIVPADSDGPSADDVFAYCRSQLAVFKVPRYIEFRAELPKTATFKVQKNRLLEDTDPSTRIDRYDHSRKT